MNVALFRANQRKVAQRALRSCATPNRKKRSPLPYVFIGFLVMAVIASASALDRFYVGEESAQVGQALVQAVKCP